MFHIQEMEGVNKVSCMYYTYTIIARPSLIPCLHFMCTASLGMFVIGVLDHCV